MPLYTVHLKGRDPVVLDRPTSNDAFHAAMEPVDGDIEQFVSIYINNPTPLVNARYGAPMGRPSASFSLDGVPKVDRIELDGGYDPGGAYWGLRPSGISLYAVQDGDGNVIFVDARSERHALEVAKHPAAEAA